MLALACESCGQHLCNYQKDGPGPLKRLYLDRMEPAPAAKQLKCPSCGEVLGTHIIYKKENRPAYRLYVGSIIKTIIPADS